MYINKYLNTVVIRVVYMDLIYQVCTEDSHFIFWRRNIRLVLDLKLAGEDGNGVTISCCLLQFFFSPPHLYKYFSDFFLSHFICTFEELYLGLVNLCGKIRFKTFINKHPLNFKVSPSIYSTRHICEGGEKKSTTNKWFKNVKWF